jgi:dihydroorotase
VYDLVLRDATLVTSSGRLVADVAIEGGKIAYVGPHPPKRKTRDEINAMGRFVMPGVIDTAIQVDPNGDPGIWESETRAALSGGVTTVIVLPGGDNAVVDKASAKKRIKRGAGRSWCHFGLWGQARSGNSAEMLDAAEKKLVQGVLAFAGGDDSRAISAAALERFANCDSVLGVQIDGEEDEVAAIGKSLLHLAASRTRPLHLLHLSTAAEVALLDPVRGNLPVTASVTPHHLFFAEETLSGLSKKMTTRPPVRPEQDRRTLWTAIKRGRLDCIASDHHPLTGKADCGVPSSELLFPLMLSAVKFGRLSLEGLVSLCAESPARIFGLENKGRIVAGADADIILFTEGELAKVEPDTLMSMAGWSPYADKDIAPKPEIVISGGRIVARKGKIVGDEPRGTFVGEA